MHRHTISRSALYVNVLLIFEMHDLNGGLFLNATSLSGLSFSFAAAAKRSIVPFTTIYASLLSHKYDLNIDVFNLFVDRILTTCLSTEFLPLDKSFTLIHFFVTNLDTVDSFNDLNIL